MYRNRNSRLPRVVLVAASVATVLSSCAQPLNLRTGAAGIAERRQDERRTDTQVYTGAERRSGEERRTYGRVKREMAALIERAMARADIPGISLALVDEEGLVWSQGFGYADRSKDVPATPETVYRVGSIAKLFTATAVMRLAEEGRVDLDKPLADYLPGFSIKSRFQNPGPITPRLLLTHHAGLPCDLNKGMWTDAPFTRVAAQLGQEYAPYPPGYIFSYSNLGYTLLGHMVSAVSGTRFADFMDGRVLKPMGMDLSSFEPSPTIKQHLATGYRNGRPGAQLPIRDLPAAALYTDAIDLAHFMQNLVSDSGRGQVLSHAAVTEMLRIQNRRAPLDFGVRTGLGWFIDPQGLYGSGPIARHGGATPLFTSELILLPKERLGVTVLSNSGNARQAVRFLAESTIKAVLEARGYQPSEPPRTTAGHFTPGGRPVPANLGGRYATDIGIVDIYPAEQRLEASTLGKSFELIPYADGTFRLKNLGAMSRDSALRGLEAARLRYTRVEDRDLLIVRYQGSQHLFGTKVSRAPISRTWLKRIGHYRLLNPDPGFPVKDVCVLYQDGAMYLEYAMPLISRRPVRVAIAPISDTEALTLGLGRARGETIRASGAADATQIYFSGYRAARVN